MPKVVVLDQEVADKIAAGEVVDRPSSIVKELVENSIDAGATRVELDLEEGGKRRIAVTDNGCGMVLEDAVLALERHATSKIRTADDLFAIRTLGFRGEALPSIAAVATLRITTRAEGQESGVEITVERGQVAAVDGRGVPPGTQVVVSDLFGNVPARLKFLKATQTELAHILDLMVRFALSYPHIQFRVTHNARQLFSAPGSGDALNTVVAAYGREVAREMLPVNPIEGLPVVVRGYVSRPAVTRAGRMHQSFFVNGRLVRSPMLSRALDEAFKGYVPQGRYPVSCLFITVDPAVVDVNVHPTKMEVRFADDRPVFDVVLRSVRATLAGANLAAPAVASTDPTPPAAPTPTTPPRSHRVEQSIVVQSAGYDPFAGDDAAREPSPQSQYQTGRPAAPPPGAGGQHGFAPWRLRPSEPQATLSLDLGAAAPQPAETPASNAATPAPAVGGSTLPELNPVARVLDTYVVCEGPDAVYIIDQHAAHERVLYDALLRRDSDDVTSQALLIPVTLNLSHADAQVLEAHRDHLAELGFQIEPFGKDAYVLRAVPMLLVGRNYARVLQDVIDDLRERGHSGRLEDERAEICALLACHSVTRSGDALQPEEMRRLVQDLRESPAPYTCAHGRPTMLVLPRGELERKIGRG